MTTKPQSTEPKHEFWYTSVFPNSTQPLLKVGDKLEVVETKDDVLDLHYGNCFSAKLARLSPASAAPVVDKARYEKAHDARYVMTHPVHPDILVLWFLALKSHWFDDPANMFFGHREQAKAYLYKWVETGELADDNTTLEIAIAMKFREWLKESWTPAAATAAPQNNC